jgi:hypothetical protein
MGEPTASADWASNPLLDRFFIARHATIPLTEVLGMQEAEVKKWIAAITGFPELTDESEEIVEYNQADASREELIAGLLRRNRAIVTALASGNGNAWLDLEVNQGRLDLLHRADI